MQFDPENSINKLYAQGMEFEGEGKREEASTVFNQAWEEASTPAEKFTAAHYIARHQDSVAEKLKWDQVALNIALAMDGDDVKGTYPSLYLNVAKCYEDLNDFTKARENYLLALSFSPFLLNDGYGDMIKSGINRGLERVA